MPFASRISVEPTQEDVNACASCGARDYETTGRSSDVSPDNMKTIWIGPRTSCFRLTLCQQCRATLVSKLS